MKTSVLVAGFLALGVGGAAAADLAAKPYTKAPVIAPGPVVSWTGCYIGGNVGYGSSDKSFYVPVNDPFTPGALLGSHTASGVVAGGQIGCDYQFGGQWVVGVQGMGDWSDMKGSSPIIQNPLAQYATRIRDFETISVRLGFLATPNLLFYAKGGAAWVRDHFEQNRTVAAQGLPVGNYANADATRSGYVVGVGGEYLITRNWSIFGEYNYIGLGGTRSTTFISTALSPAGAGAPFNLDVWQSNVQVGMIGLNYRFNLTGPVAAKY